METDISYELLTFFRSTAVVEGDTDTLKEGNSEGRSHVITLTTFWLCFYKSLLSNHNNQLYNHFESAKFKCYLTRSTSLLES